MHWDMQQNMRSQVMSSKIKPKELKDLKREIKRAKLFEVQRHVRRIKQLKERKGCDAKLKANQRKVERFLKELEFLKDADVGEIIGIVTKEYGQDGVEQVENEPVDSVDHKKRALDRIINSKTLQQFLQKRKTTNIKQRGAVGRKLNKPFKKTGETRGVYGIGTDVTKRKVNMEDAREKGMEKKPKSVERVLSNAIREREESKLPGECDRESWSDTEHPNFGTEETSRNNNMLGHESLLQQGFVGDDFSISSEFSGDEFQDESSDMCSLPKPKSFESCFVGSMSRLKGRKAAKLKKRQFEKKGIFKQRKGTTNRPGQRTRQMMWKNIHGSDAKHLQKKRQKEGNTKGRIKIVKQEKKAKTYPVPKKEENIVEKPLHPSWEAMKKKRSKETLNVEFKGKKIKFDDSE